MQGTVLSFYYFLSKHIALIHEMYDTDNNGESLRIISDTNTFDYQDIKCIIHPVFQT